MSSLESWRVISDRLRPHMIIQRLFDGYYPLLKDTWRVFRRRFGLFPSFREGIAFRAACGQGRKLSREAKSLPMRMSIERGWKARSE